MANKSLPWNLSSHDALVDDHQVNILNRAAVVLSQPYNIVGLVIAILAIASNTLSLGAIYHLRTGINTHIRILLSLIVSDLMVDFTFISHVINSIFNELHSPGEGPWYPRLKSRCVYMVLKALNTTGLNIALLNLLAMAINHFIAILYPFHLPVLLSRKRAIVMIMVLWVIAFITGFSDFYSIQWGQTNDSGYNVCEQMWISEHQEEYLTFSIAVVCFIAMLYMYIRIYCSAENKLNTDALIGLKKRNRKALVTTMLIMGTFTLCWLPLCIYTIVLIIVVHAGPEALATIYPILYYLKLVDSYLYDLMLLNTLLDPIIYAVRITEVRRGYLLLFGKFTTEGSQMQDRLHRRYSRSSMIGASLPSRRSTANSFVIERCGSSVTDFEKFKAQQYLMSETLDEENAHELKLLRFEDSITDDTMV